MRKEKKSENKEFKYLIGPTNSVTIQINSKNIHLLIKEIKTNKKFNVSFGEIILHAICQSLKDFPKFNSNFDEKLKIYPKINVGFFINLGKGSRMLVIKDADKKSLVELSSEVKDLALKYIHDELSELDTKNSTFSVTDLASFNVYLTIPPILKHQSAMISIASEFDSFEILKGKLVPAKKFNMTLSYDPRIADCQKAIQFLNSIKDNLEENKKKV